MEYSQKYCAFIDVLGLKEALNDWDKAMKFYNDLVVTIFPDTLKLVKDHVPGLSDDIEWNIFSDSIIITSKKASSLTYYVAMLFNRCLELGYFIRGCIAYGNHFINVKDNNIFIISLAMKDAYEGESKLAKYPRIIIHPDSLEKFSTEFFEKVTPAKSSLLIQGEDNLWFINPFYLGKDLERTAHQINKSIKQYKNEPFINKYYWLADLHNIFAAPRVFHEKLKTYYKIDSDYLKVLEHLYTTNSYGERELCVSWEGRETYNCFFFPTIRPYSFPDDLERIQHAEKEISNFRQVFTKSFLLNVPKTLLPI